ncbi:AdoMet-dependent rRNA methyltransferase spb1, partial [Rhizopus stolonifer]
DVVLHDGAPNVGRAWIHDAFSQSELVLVSLKLATEFLAKGGTFVTKVFRSKDYNKLLWVFQQLFRKVEATKPPSSRNVSAEIFVVCRDFVAPKRIDPRILDPKSVFSDVGAEEQKKLTDIFKPDKKNRHREGYEDDNYTMHKTIDIMEFMRSQDPITVLGSYNQFTWHSDEAKALLERDITTEDVKINSEDLKVLGKGDFKALLKWRAQLREEYKMDKKEEEKKAEVLVEQEPMDEDELLEAELANLTKEEAAKRKREKRKANEKKMKLIQRMQLNMIVPTDIALDENNVGDQEIFNIKKIKQDESLAKLHKGDMSMADDLDSDDDDVYVDKSLKGRIREMDYEMENAVVDSDEEYERDLEQQMNENYTRYKQQRAEKDAKFRAKQAREEEDEWTGFDDKKKKNENRDKRFDSDSDSSDSDSTPKQTNRKTNSLMNDLGEKAALSKKTASGLTTAASMFFDQDIFQDVALDELKALETGLTTAESITLARQLANKEKTVEDLIDLGFSKEAFRDKDGLPEWFLDDEKKHNKPNLPVTKEAMNQLRAKLRALDARPIKKVAEAKARKKFKAAQRIAKAQKKATDIADNPDMTEKEKAKNIGKLIARATKSKPKKEVKVVVAKGANRGVKGRPKGVKGRYKMVDGKRTGNGRR